MVTQYIIKIHWSYDLSKLPKFFPYFTMFSFGKKTGIFTNKEEENSNSPRDTWGFSKLFAHKYFTPNFEHQASDGNINLKHDHTKNFICHPENKIIHCFEGETCRPIVPLPASLVTEIVSEKEGRIHALEENISHLQNEFQKTKMKSCRELKRLWSLRNNSMKGRKQSISMQRNITLRKALSSPNLTWGRRGQLISLLESIKSSVKSANNSRENIFSSYLVSFPHKIKLQQEEFYLNFDQG
ncbi:hypothetical protein J437_LFUL007982 [Ladona fulva]|uniref:Uncharacterized protein n=1 Tax=Ladona fulva TaxID=123851 RepID=A0A8K0K5L9_LADFU|nr:hypothetical protein J437_LFUL007982 [Ladona fulva]